jgi:hypothetical protein
LRYFSPSTRLYRFSIIGSGYELQEGSKMMHITMHRANQIDVEKPIPGALTFIEKGKAQQEALHVAATKGGLIMIRGREMQPKGSHQDLHGSPTRRGKWIATAGKRPLSCHIRGRYEL